MCHNHPLSYVTCCFFTDHLRSSNSSGWLFSHFHPAVQPLPIRHFSHSSSSFSATLHLAFQPLPIRLFSQSLSSFSAIPHHESDSPHIIVMLLVAHQFSIVYFSVSSLVSKALFFISFLIRLFVHFLVLLFLIICLASSSMPLSSMESFGF